MATRMYNPTLRPAHAVALPEQTQTVRQPRYTWQATCGHATAENPSCALPDIDGSWVTNHFLAAADCGVHFSALRCLLFVLFCLFLRSRFVNRPALVSRFSLRDQPIAGLVYLLTIV